MTANVFESVGREKRWWTLTQTRRKVLRLNTGLLCLEHIIINYTEAARKDWLDDVFSQRNIDGVWCSVLVRFYCASVSLCELVSSSYGRAGWGRHQDLIQGEACWERHSSGDFITLHRMNPAIASLLQNISGSILVTPNRIQKQNLLTEAGFIPLAPKRSKSEGLVVDWCLWACGSCKILTNMAA